MAPQGDINDLVEIAFRSHFRWSARRRPPTGNDYLACGFNSEPTTIASPEKTYAAMPE
jgi:hypothetical protein